jgi:FHS family L-fucose permease-like MFS transporter
MGLIAGAAGGLHVAMALPLICFAVVALFARGATDAPLSPTMRTIH